MCTIELNQTHYGETSECLKMFEVIVFAVPQMSRCTFFDNIYIYMTNTYDGLFFFSSFMWLDSLAAGAGAFSSLSWSLSCPFHCGSSLLLPALLGFVCGLCCGLLLAVSLWTFLRPPLDFAPPPASPHPGFEGVLRRRSSARLRGYLHE